MNWQYHTILFEFQKEGLLGDRYIDEDDVEKILNEEGEKGWELVSVTPIREGLLAFCKRPVKSSSEEQRNVKLAHAPERILAGREPEITAELLREQEKEHIRNLERQRRETMCKQEEDLIGEIKIR